MSHGQTVVFGTTGQVAQSLKPYFPAARFLGRSDVDFDNSTQVVSALNRERPKVVILAAAYTGVDQAEIEIDRAMRVNAETPGRVAEWCKSNSASLVYYSTDYVYSGEGERPWRETDDTFPLNTYGRSKLAGEDAIAASGCHHYILRTSWIFSPFGKNFVKTILRLATEKDTLSVVADQVGAPTYSADLAHATFKLAAHQKFREVQGVFHVTNSGFVSWHGFAEIICKEAKRAGFPLKVQSLNPIPSSQYRSVARRPQNSRLDCAKIAEVFDIQLRGWQEGLVDCLSKLKNL